MARFSVLMCVYSGEKVDNLDQALKSIIQQTLIPDEIILIKDGQLNHALDKLIEDYASRVPYLKVYSLETNMGLGMALNFGLNHCTNELVARMDSDDISKSDRFSKQVSFMVSNPDVAVCGSHIEEFANKPGDLRKIKKVPVTYAEIRSFARVRNPINHPTVIFRKAAVLSVGSYKPMPLFEDYYLWLRLINKGFRLENIDETLLYFRVGNMIRRRQGSGYYKKELYFLLSLRQQHLISKYQFWLLVATRLPFRILPSKLLGLVYTIFLRKGEVTGKRQRIL